MSVYSSEETVSEDSLMPPGDSKLDAGLAQIDACNFNSHPMLVYTFDDNVASCSAVCCLECAEAEDFDVCCKPKPKRQCCPKPCPRPRRRCKPKVCCKSKVACKRKPKKCSKPRKKPCCPKRKPRACPKRC